MSFVAFRVQHVSDMLQSLEAGQLLHRSTLTIGSSC